MISSSPSPSMFPQDGVATALPVEEEKSALQRTSPSDEQQNRVVSIAEKISRFPSSSSPMTGEMYWEFSPRVIVHSTAAVVPSYIILVNMPFSDNTKMKILESQGFHAILDVICSESAIGKPSTKLPFVFIRYSESSVESIAMNDAESVFTIAGVFYRGSSLVPSETGNPSTCVRSGISRNSIKIVEIMIFISKKL